MKTVTTTRYKTAIEDWKMSWYHQESEDFREVTDTAEGLTAAAAYLACPIQLLDSLQMTLLDLRDCAKADLVDIWGRLEALEKRIAQLER